MGMGNPAGVRRDFDQLEQRRLEGAGLLRRGVPQAEVARRVGAHRQSVSQWAGQLERGGRRGARSEPGGPDESRGSMLADLRRSSRD